MKSTKLIFAGALMTVLMISTSYATVKNNYSNTTASVEEKTRGLVNSHLLPALTIEEVAVPQPEKAAEFNNRYTPQQMAVIVGLWENESKATQSSTVAPVVVAAPAEVIEVAFPGADAPESGSVEKTYSPEQFVSVMEIKF